jgi:hypothetical protein
MLSRHEAQTIIGVCVNMPESLLENTLTKFLGPIFNGCRVENVQMANITVHWGQEYVEARFHISVIKSNSDPHLEIEGFNAHEHLAILAFNKKCEVVSATMTFLGVLY